MNNINFKKLPRRYFSEINQIEDPVLQKIYAQLNYSYFQFPLFEEIKNEYIISARIFIQEYIKDYKLLIYDYTEEINCDQKLKMDKQNENTNSLSQTVNSFICIEGELIFLENIDISILNNIITKNKYNVKKVGNFMKIVNKTNEEIFNFCQYFQKEIDKNNFVKMTINSIAGFLIQRFNYPTEYFKDPTFFKFNTKENFLEHSIKMKLSNLLSSKVQINSEELSQILNDIKTMKNKNKIEIFEKSNFITLRKINSTDKSYLNLVIHIESLHVFALKRIKRNCIKEFKHEKEFCQQYSHRCLTKFYGFLTEEDQIIGFVYEYMPNKTLSDYLSPDKNEINNIYRIMTIIRLFEGINYLHSNNLIHRDLKPINILIDHDFLPHISDFDTTRSIQNDDENFTVDIGSLNYSSPEQDTEKPLSYSTDIYSFGLIIYFIFECKSMRLFNNSNLYQKSENDKIIPISNCSSNIQYIYQNCIKFNPLERLKINEIGSILSKELNTLDFLGKILTIDKTYIPKSQIIQFIYEVIYYQNETNHCLNSFFDNIMIFQLLFDTQNDNKDFILLYLGDCYRSGRFCEISFDKAKNYYQKAANQNNSEALVKIGNLFKKGLGVDHDYLKAKEYYIMSVKLNNSNALIQLGKLYEYGYGVEENQFIAIKFYERAAEQNNINALFKLGEVYEDLHDYSKAKYYYERAIEKNSIISYVKLANFYYDQRNYLKAKFYFEIAAERNNSKALCQLGKIYINGHGVEIDTSKAKMYFEQAAQLNNSEALYELGNMYKNGENVPQDYFKAKMYYEKAYQLNDSHIIYFIAGIYKNGDGFLQDYLMAKKYYEKALQFNYYKAFEDLGNLYFNGNGVKKDHYVALQYYEKAADYGCYSSVDKLIEISNEGFDLKKIIKNSNVLYEIGNKYYYKNEYYQAKKYYELASIKNHLESYCSLGSIYQLGHGVQKNYNVSKYYYMKASRLNSSKAFYELGNIYSDEENYLQAIKYYEIAAELQNSKALIELGRMYYHGDGVAKNLLKAEKYYEKAVKLGSSIAILELGDRYWSDDDKMNNIEKARECYESVLDIFPEASAKIGMMYEFGEFDDEPNYFMAKKYYELSSQKNYGLGLVLLGLLYEKNMGVEKHDFKKAKECYEKAIQQGESKGYIYLGMLYEKGCGVAKDYLKAYDLYDKAQKKRDTSGLCCIANLYFHGYIGEQNYFLANYFYMIAADKNDSTALNNMGFLYENKYLSSYDLTIFFCLRNNLIKNYNEINNLDTQLIIKIINSYENCSQNYLDAKDFYEKAAKLNDVNSFLYLGNIYKKGLGVLKNYEKAKEYYELAAKNNNVDALFYLGEFYSRGDILDVNVEKAIFYFNKCYEISKKMRNYNLVDNYMELGYKVRGFDSISLNNIGLIYMIELNDQKNAEIYLQKAANDEYPFGQNNFGLFNELFLNKKNYSYYYYNRSMKHNFALAEYNIGHLLENDGKKSDAVSHYIKASKYEDEPLCFKGYEYHDKRLEISKTFIICLTNLKLFQYYCSQLYFEEAKKYFIKSCAKLKIIDNNDNSLSYSFRFIYDKKNVKNRFVYLKSFYLNYPLFNFKNQPNLDLNLNFFNQEQEVIKKEKQDEEKGNKFNNLKLSKFDEEKENKFNDLKLSKFDEEKENKFNDLKLFKFDEEKENKFNDLKLSKFDEEKENKFNDLKLFKFDKYSKPFIHQNDELEFEKKNDRIVFNDPGKLFYFAINNDKIAFINEINEIIQIMNDILYTYPYSILFGRIKIEKENSKQPKKSFLKDIDKYFYEGLGIKEFQYKGK